MKSEDEAAQLIEQLRRTIEHYADESENLTVLQVIGILEVLKDELLSRLGEREDSR